MIGQIPTTFGWDFSDMPDVHYRRFTVRMTNERDGHAKLCDFYSASVKGSYARGIGASVEDAVTDLLKKIYGKDQ
jgi:hypothetical protein